MLFVDSERRVPCATRQVSDIELVSALIDDGLVEPVARFALTAPKEWILDVALPGVREMRGHHLAVDFRLGDARAIAELEAHKRRALSCGTRASTIDTNARAISALLYLASR